MAVHASTKANYFKPKNGVFVQWNGYEEVEAGRGISGKLSRITVTDDPGDAKRKIAPGHKVNVSLEDNGEFFVISFKAESTFGWMLARSLENVKKGAPIIIETSHGDDEKISMAWLSFMDGGQKAGKPALGAWPSDRDDKIAKAVQVFKNHEATPNAVPVDDLDPFAD